MQSGKETQKAGWWGIDEALKQIEEKQYITNMKKEGINQFMKIGVAFYKNEAKLVFCRQKKDEKQAEWWYNYFDL